MLASAPRPSPDLARLEASLKHLIEQAEAGEWEAIVAMQPIVSQQLADIEIFYAPPGAASTVSAAERTRLSGIIALITKAEALCASRREQVAPLINSLKALPGSSTA